MPEDIRAKSEVSMKYTMRIIPSSNSMKESFNTNTLGNASDVWAAWLELGQDTPVSKVASTVFSINNKRLHET